MNRNAGFTAGILALLALLARSPSPTGAPHESQDQADTGKTKKDQSQSVGQPPQPYEGPWIATRHFFQAYGSLPSYEDFAANIADLKEPDSILKCFDPTCLSQLRKFFGLPDDIPIDCLLATVPDPFHTRLALYTDHTIGAIRRGAGHQYWEFATQWLPWIDTIDPNEGDPAKRAQQRDEIREQEKQPGVLVFRHAARATGGRSKASWEPGALLVFIVGETPTAGVNPYQFRIARAYMDAFSRPQDARDDNNVRIDGPTFSGSLYSLARSIDQESKRNPNKSYQVRSGTVQSWAAIEAFKSVAGPDFFSATESLKDQDLHLAAVLPKLHISPENAAVLAEDESAFGRAASRQSNRNSDIRIFRYPRDISHLRNAYHVAVQSSKSDRTPAPSLDFSLKDPSIGEDSVPTYSPTQTPLSQNGVINEITRTIRGGDIRIVELSGTNVFDLLFLAGVLRRQCPDTRVLVQFADLLFVQGEQTQPLDGTLFLTSYPLFGHAMSHQPPRMEGEDPGTGTIIRVEPDTRSEGTTDATALLLMPADDRRPRADPPVLPPAPAAWLLTLDHRGFSPVTCWASDAAKRRFKNSKFDVTYPRTLNLVAGLFALIGIVTGWWMRELERRDKWIVNARFAPPVTEVSWRVFFLLLFLLVLIAIQLMIFLAQPSPKYWPRLALMLPGCGLPAWMAWRIGRRYQAAKHGWEMWVLSAAVLSAIVLWSICCFGFGPQGQCFSFRAAEMRFGSSPLWPIVSAAVALLLWCFVHVTRLYFAACQEPEVFTGLTVLRERLHEAHYNFRESARSALGLYAPNQQKYLWAALGVLAALCGLSRVDIHLASIDGVFYDILCIVLQILVAGMLLLTCGQIRILSKSLHCFTTSLDTLPLGRAFIQPSRSGGNRPIWVQRFNLQSLDVYTGSMLVLHDMRLQVGRTSQRELDWLSQWSQLYRRLIENLLAVNRHRGRKELSGQREELCCFGKVLACRIWESILQPAWASQPLVGRLADASTELTKEAAAGSSTVTHSRPQPLEIPGDPKSLSDLAETFVALHYSPFLLYAVKQIQNLLWFPSIGFVLLLLAMKSYNFQSPHIIDRCLLILFVVIAGVLCLCMVEMERDPILSRLAGSKPGELNASFYLNLCRYGALPILGLLASQFPTISNFLLSWMQPALEALQ